MSQITLFDLPSKGRCACWSLNPWKTRLALNYKNLDYKTEWLEYPDVEPALKPRLAPNADASAKAYTIPAVKLASEYVMDSKAIATRLEQLHPTPSLHLDSPVLKEVEALIPKVQNALRGIWMPLVPTNLLNERSREYFERTRAVTVGKPLQEYAKTNGGEEAWIEALPAIKSLGGVVQRGDGPFVLGKEVSYTDFVIVSMLHFFRVIDEGIYQRVVDSEASLGKLYEASKQWLERDAY